MSRSIEPAYSSDPDEWKSRILFAVRDIILADIAFPINTESYEIATLESIIDQTQNLWYQVFTDWSASLNNYENIETVGDAIEKHYFLDLCVEYGHNSGKVFTPEQLNGLNVHYGSNAFHLKCIKEMTSKIPARGCDWKTKKVIYEDGELGQLILVASDLVFKISEKTQYDIYEAMLYAIEVTGDEYAAGLGTIWARLFVKKMHTVDGEFVIDLRNAKGKSVGALQKLFDRFGYSETDNRVEGPRIWKKKISTEGAISHATVQVTIEAKTYAFMMAYARFHTDVKYNDNYRNLKIGTVIAEGTGYDVREAKADGAAKAMEVLENDYGITPEWAKEHKELYDGTQIDERYVVSGKGIGVYTALTNKLVSLGYYKIVDGRKVANFETEGSNNKIQNIPGSQGPIKLIGIRSDESREQLAVLIGGGNKFKAKAELFAKYLGVSTEPKY